MFLQVADNLDVEARQISSLWKLHPEVADQVERVWRINSKDRVTVFSSRR
jgi:hypothetical protein